LVSGTPDWALVVHGGAGMIERGSLSAEEEQSVRAALTRALEAGAAVLEAGGAALDAAEAAVWVLEDDPNFNAGRGSVFTYDGAIEMDAAVMDGRSRDAGAVTGVRRTRHPVSLARRVMEDSPHVLLSREGADAFSVEQRLEQADPDWFATPERRRQLDELKAQGDGYFDVQMKYGTVGAVARDKAGHLAAATSTGGITALAPMPMIGLVRSPAQARASSSSAPCSRTRFAPEPDWRAKRCSRRRAR
jgi:L-asparaginase / beta-aspartyl-peptidase